VPKKLEALHLPPSLRIERHALLGGASEAFL
jgi:hypothetical protein